MFPRENRLTRKKDFDRVFEQGKSCFTSILGIKSCPNDLHHVRSGIIISNKVSKLATERNKIRRQIRAILYERSLDLSEGADYVIICQATIKKANPQAIERDIKFCLNRLRPGRSRRLKERS